MRVFTPLKNHIVVGVRPNGLDIMDMDEINTDNFICESHDYNFK